MQIAYKPLYNEQLKVSKYLEQQVKQYQYIAFGLALGLVVAVAIITVQVA